MVKYSYRVSGLALFVVIGSDINRHVKFGLKRARGHTVTTGCFNSKPDVLKWSCDLDS